MATITIAYPSGPSFNLEYYLDTHMAIVVDNWKQLGLQGYEIVRVEPGQKYQIQAILKWDNLSSWEAAVASDAATAVFGDIAKFTEAKPDIVKGSTQVHRSLL